MKRRKIQFCVLVVLAFAATISVAQSAAKTQLLAPAQYVQYQSSANAFPIIANDKAAKIFIDSEDWKAVIRAANDLGDDVRKVSGTASEIIQATKFSKRAILVGIAK